MVARTHLIVTLYAHCPVLLIYVLEEKLSGFFTKKSTLGKERKKSIGI
jgi:hypothetical protein